MPVSCECYVLSGRILCVGLGTRREESYENEEALVHKVVTPW
jgi:hypothetical protein